MRAQAVHSCSCCAATICREHGQPSSRAPDSPTCLPACPRPQAEHPPYDLPPLYARRAAAVFEDMLAAGVRPNLVLWHNLLDCQVGGGGRGGVRCGGL